MRLFFFMLFVLNAIIIPNGKVKSGSYEIDLEILEFIRISYYASVENEDLIEQIEKYIVKNFSAEREKYPNLILAYVAALESVKSKHAFWPLTKLKLLNKSMDIFKVVISREPSSLEIRFLRFAILHHVPGFLGYSAERDSDADEILVQLLLKDYSSIKEEIQIGIAQFLYTSERLVPAKQKILRDNFALKEDE
jgi:hypothetical protein